MLVNEPTSRRTCVVTALVRLCRAVKALGHHIPPKPVAKPTVPSVASISMMNEPNTFMPQLVRDLRYCGHIEHGVEISESMSLSPERVSQTNSQFVPTVYIPVATFDIMIVTAYAIDQKQLSFSHTQNLPDPTPPMINDRTALMVGNCRTVEVILSVWW